MSVAESDRRRELVLVEWGDPSGADGFVEHHGDGGAAPTAYVRVTERLLEDRIKQPAPDLPDPETDPAWSLVHTEVEGQQCWCFVVQGRGRAFGRAGGCQFLYGACADYRPDELWRAGAAAVGLGGRLRLRQPGPFLPLPGSSSVDAQAARDLVHGLALGRGAVELDLRPADCASLFVAAFAVLPDGVVRARTWSTMPPRTRNSSGPLLVTSSGTTPAPEAVAPPADRRNARAAEWLADQIARREPFSPDLRHASSMAAVLDVVDRDILPLDPADVPRLLADRTQGSDPARRSRLDAADGLAAVQQWARAHPQPALGWFVPAAVDRDRVTASLGRGLLDAVEVDRMAPADLGMPPFSEPAPGWHAALAFVIRDAHPEPASRAAWLERHLIAEGGPLADPEARWRHRNWLLSVSPDGNAYEVFPPEYLLADAVEGRRPLPSQLVGDARASAALREQALVRCATLGVGEIGRYLRLAGLDGGPTPATLIGEALASRSGDDAYLLTLLRSPELAPWRCDLVAAIDAFLPRRGYPAGDRLHFALVADRESLPPYLRKWAASRLAAPAVATRPPDAGSRPQPLPARRTFAVEITPAVVPVPARRRHATGSRIDRMGRLFYFVFVLLTVALLVAAAFLYYPSS